MTDPMVRVVWRDAHAMSSGWTHRTELDREPYEVVTVGFLLTGEKPGHLSIAQSVAPGGHVDNVAGIPIGMVISIDYLTARRGLPLERVSDGAVA